MIIKCLNSKYNWWQTASEHRHVDKYLNTAQVQYFVMFSVLSFTIAQSISSHSISLRSSLILSSHLLLGLPSRFFLSDFQTKLLYTFLISLMHATCPILFIFLDVITPIIIRWIQKEAPHDAYLFKFLLPASGYIRIFSWTPCSQEPSIYRCKMFRVITVKWRPGSKRSNGQPILCFVATQKRKQQSNKLTHM
jgi:hypothetical protein